MGSEAILGEVTFVIISLDAFVIVIHDHKTDEVDAVVVAQEQDALSLKKDIEVSAQERGEDVSITLLQRRLQGSYLIHDGTGLTPSKDY